MYDEVFVCLNGEWIQAQWDSVCVGVWIGNAWYNMGQFDAYMYSYTE